jgi:FAD/FMN-containing dehydrogenase
VGEVKKDKATLDTYSRDASIFRIVPSEVVIPKNIEDVKKVIRSVIAKRDAGDTKISVTARSAGTDMSGGPLSDSIIISFTEHINKIKKVTDEYAIVESGCYYRDFEKETLKLGKILPSYPASRELCAIGGIFNNNSGGEKSLRYGETIDYVESVKMICSDGNEYEFREYTGDDLDNLLENDTTFYGDLHRAIYKLVTDNYDAILAAKPNVTKNSSGYFLWHVYNKQKHSLNLAKIICGGQGTLGITTDIKLKLVNNPTYSKMMVVMVKKVSDIPSIVNAVNPHNPESFELYDDHTFKIAMKYLPDITKRLGGSLITLGFKFLPEFWMILTGGVPKIISLAEFTGNSQQEVDDMAHKAFLDIQKLDKEGIRARVIETESEAKKYWVFRRESFNLLRSKLKGVRTTPFIEDVVIHKDDFPTFLPEFEKILDDSKLLYTIAGHVGDGNLHVIPLMDLKKDETIEKIKNVSFQVYDLVRKYRGSITGEHNDGLIRTPFLNEMYSQNILNLFQKVKNIFDPKNIFNPGKKVGTNWETAIKYIDRTR